MIFWACVCLKADDVTSQGYDASASVTPVRIHPMRIRDRWMLIAVLALVQMLCLGGALLLMDVWLLQPPDDAPFSPTVTNLLERVRLIAGLGAAMAVILSTIITMFVIRKYESRLEATNAELMDTNEKFAVVNTAVAELNQHLEEMVDSRADALRRNRDAVVFGLAKLAESRDDETGKHLERICKYVHILGNAVARSRSGKGGIDEHWVRNITTTAALHDIGKVGVADAVLRKPGKLTPEEYKIIQSHAKIGGDALIQLTERWDDDPFLLTAADIAMSHHEKWDGSGYPNGLAGEDIPLAARIVAVADVYDALTTKRVYKAAMSHEEARKIIVNGRGSHFDPQMVDLFVEVEQDFINVAKELGD